MPPRKKRWDDLGYMGKHKRIWTLLGKAARCDNTPCKGESKTFGWANLSGKYLEDIKDWKQMCMPCHMTHDHGRGELTDKQRLRVALNSFSRIRDEINFVMKGLE